MPFSHVRLLHLVLYTVSKLLFFLILFFINLFILFIYFWLCWVFIAAHGLFSSCGERGLLFVAACGLLIAVASLVVAHRL